MNQEPLPAALAAYAGAGEQDAPYELLAEREDGTVVRCGEIVAKAHAGDSDREGLAVRMRIAADEALAGVLLAPLRPEVGYLGGRPVSLWPYGAPVDPERPEDAPWEAAGRLLAALHQVPVHRLPGPVPPMRGPAKLARALRRLARATAPGRSAGAAAAGFAGAAGPVGVPAVTGAAGSGGAAGSRTGSALVPSPAEGRPAGDLVRAAARTLPAWVRGEAPAPRGGALCHGDLHLGQLVRGPGPDGGWRLIDVDDLGIGTPAWDLARPAAWYAAGLLDTGTWVRFLDSYRAAGGPAAGPAGSDPWPELDLAARALTVQTVALALAKSVENHRRLDDLERLMVDSCARIATLPPDLEPQAPS
ncbi:phosphotransferase [Streptomyces sp. NBC_01443]|uniref:phosphotransferase family protein n=1 Tax=Streptomyces sp. NBC_01443 TaxID=2903868 RepID=UPI002251B104|nr:phosphotransferase [Streptomyces sp. NBC_01443]MCX4630871.1 phosphotransferase [Streptomyces sp. NBC_01443]